MGLVQLGEAVPDTGAAVGEPGGAAGDPALEAVGEPALEAAGEPALGAAGGPALASGSEEHAQASRAGAESGELGLVGVQRALTDGHPSSSVQGMAWRSLSLSPGVQV